jgi:aryl-alcohol dehydrogenase-like predicted oxidoreductase
MNSFQIPNTSLTVSRFCYGTGSFGTSVIGNQADKLLAKFVEAGGNFFDTAHCYAFWKSNGLGASERELGLSLKRIGAWSKAIIATKGGHPDGGVDYRRPTDFLSESIIHSDIDDSLNRLQTNCIDLFYLHRDDGITPVKEIIDRLNKQITLGRIGTIGASNWSVARIKKANEYAVQNGLKGFVISQIQWSLSQPDWSVSVDPTMRNVGPDEIEWHSQTSIPIAAYSATGNGFFSKECSTTNAINRSRWEKAQKISKRIGCTASQLALAWLLNQKPTVFPVFSTSSIEHLSEIVAADNLKLSQDILCELE